MPAFHLLRKNFKLLNIQIMQTIFFFYTKCCIKCSFISRSFLLSISRDEDFTKGGHPVCPSESFVQLTWVSCTLLREIAGAYVNYWTIAMLCTFSMYAGSNFLKCTACWSYGSTWTYFVWVVSTFVLGFLDESIDLRYLQEHNNNNPSLHPSKKKKKNLHPIVQTD